MSWTCPKCSKDLKQKSGTHLKWCGWVPTPEWFYSLVDKNGPNGCWVWTGVRNHYGRGVIDTTKTHHKRQLQAHRVAWEFLHGPITEGQHCLHRCGNGHMGCVNPEHLYLGTPADNMRDMRVMGRNRCATLTEAQVREIREALKTPHHGLQKDLAEKYGVTRGVISDIKLGHTFQHVN